MKHKINNIELFEFWTANSDLSKTEKTNLYNNTHGTSYAARTLQQRYSNFKEGVEQVSKGEIIEKSLAKKELNIMKQQKKTTLMKQELHKATRKEALRDLLADAIKKTIVVPKSVTKKVPKPKGKKVIEYVIADIQFKGGKKEADWVNHIFSNIISNIPKNQTEDTEHRLVFLGDDIEGQGAHESQLLEIKTTKINQVRELGPLLVENIIKFFKHIKKGEKSIAFVPYSNHGMAGGNGTQRYQFPDDDLGLILFDMIEHRVSKGTDIHLYGVDHNRFLVETKDTLYLHGHQGYVKSKLRMFEALGNEKRISMGHLHHYEEIEEGGTLITKYGTCRSKTDENDEIKTGRYEDMAGFYPTPQVTIRTSVGNVIETKRILL